MSSFLREIFYGKVVNNVLEFYNKPSFDRALMFLNGEEVQFTIEKKKKQRTNQQNRYYRGVVIKMLAEYFGYGPEEIEELHHQLRVKFLPRYQKGPFEFTKSTTMLSTTEMIDYTENIRRWAAKEYKLNIPDPNQVEFGESSAPQ